jgi:LPXTG-site transpeptidase (sortase) family protein
MKATLFPSVLYKFFATLMVVMLALAALPAVPAYAAACTFTSAGTGTWTTPATWAAVGAGCSTYPGQTFVGDTVIIADGNTVTLNVSPANSIASLQVGQGVSGTLTLGNNPTGRTLSITGNVTVNNGATFNTGGGGTSHVVNIGGNLSNAGTLDMTTGLVTANITFNGATNQTISGAGATNTFNLITINNTGGAGNNIVDVTSTNFTAPAGFLTLTTGVFRISNGSAITPFATGSSPTILANTGLIINNAGAVVTLPGATAASILTINGGDFELLAGTANMGNGNDSFVVSGGTAVFSGGTFNLVGDLQSTGGITTINGATINISTNLTVNNGDFELLAGTANMGNGNDSLVVSAGTAVFSGGTFNLFGNLQLTGGTTTINGATINLDPKAATNLGATVHIFEAQGAANLTFSSGSVVIVDAHNATGTGNAVEIVPGAGTKNFSGSTIQFGNGVSTTVGSVDGFDLNCGSGVVLGNIAVNNLALNLATRFVRLVNNSCIVGGNFTITAGDFRVNALDLSVRGNFTNNGTFTTGGVNTVTLDGTSAQTVGGTTATAFNNLTVNNAAGITLSNNITVNATLNLTNGLVTTGANTITVVAAGNITNASASSYINGKLARGFAAIGAKTFPVGKGGVYRPVTFNYTSAPGASTVTIEQFEAAFPGSFAGVTPINRYWDISQSIANGPTFQVTLDGTGFAPTGIPVMLKDDGGITTSNATSFAAPNYTNTVAFNTLSNPTDFTLGDLDNVPPTVTVNQAGAQADPTNATPINFDVVFSEAINPATFTTADITQNGTATGITWSITNSGDNINFTLSATAVTTDGTLIPSIGIGTFADVAGNNNTAASTSTDNTVTYDTTAPTVTIGAPSVALTNTGPVDFAVTVVGANTVTLTAGNVTLNTTGTATGTITVTNGGTANPTVTISGITGDGTIGISIAAGIASDSAGNTSAAAGPSATFTVDNTAPTVTIGAPSVALTNTGPVDFAVTVAGANTVALTAADVTLNTTGTATGTIVVTNGGTANPTVTISGITGDGTIGISIAAGIASDTAGNTSAAAGPSATFTVDNTTPIVTIGAPSVALTNTGPVDFAVTVVGANTVTLTAADVTLNTTGTATGTIVVTNGGTANPTVTIGGITGDGTIGISIAAGIASDTTGNTSAAAGPSATFTVDNTAPTVTIDQAGGQADPTSGSPIDFTVVFSETVTGFSAADVDLSASTAGGTLVASVSGAGPTYTVSVTGMTTSGTVIASIPASVVTDSAGNNNFASTSTDNTVAFVDVAPTVTINQAAGQADPTNSSPIDFTVVFSETVTGFTAADVDLSASTVGGTLVASVSGTGPTYTVSVTGMTTSGTVVASIPASVVTDSVGNNNFASTSTDNTVTYDAAAPTVTIDQAGGQADPTNASPINFTVVFSEATTNFATGDVTLSGTAGATTATVTGSGTTYNVAVSGMTGNGTVIATIAAGVATDAASNPNLVSTSTDNTVTYNTSALTVTIDQAGGQPDPTNTSPINFTVVFGAATADFATGDVTLSGTAGATTAIVTGSGTTYNVAVSGMTGDGTVIATIAAGVATDAASNSNAASTSTDNTVTYSTSALTVTIDQAGGQADPTNTSPINFTVVFSAATTDFATGDVTLSGTAGATTATVTGSGTTYNVAVSGMTGSGTVIATIAAGVATDAASNPNTISTSIDNTVTYDSGIPTVVSTDLTASYTGTGPGSFIATFSEAVDDPAGNTGTDDVTNPANYLLVNKGTNGVANTVSCAGGVVADDTQVTVMSVSYNNVTFTATVTLVSPLPVGSYRLFICGSTSVVDLAGNPLNGGTDYTFDFVVTPQQGGNGGGTNQQNNSLPATGFPQDKATTLPIQPAEKAYTSTDLWLEIPKLGVKMSIVGVPSTKSGWDVTWLGKNAGWLNGSAFPTWNGNSVLTGHVWDALNRPGPFAQLKSLKYGDQIKIHAFGQVYTYEIRASQAISPTSLSTVFKHEEKSWITLVTCEDYKELSKTYSYRRMVRAVLISVDKEK